MHLIIPFVYFLEPGIRSIWQVLPPNGLAQRRAGEGDSRAGKVAKIAQDIFGRRRPPVRWSRCWAAKLIFM